MKRCGHLVPFRTKSLPRPTSKARQQQRPQPSRTPPTQGVYVACVPASVRHACSFPCRLLQRGLHDAVCLLVSCLLVLVFVLHACSCLSRTLPRGQGGIAGTAAAGAGRWPEPPLLAWRPGGVPEALAAVQGGAERTAGSRRKLESREVSSLAGLEFRDRRDCMTPKVRFLDGVVCVLLSRGALSRLKLAGCL